MITKNHLETLSLSLTLYIFYGTWGMKFRDNILQIFRFRGLSVGYGVKVTDKTAEGVAESMNINFF